MSTALPAPIAAYIEAKNQHDTAAMLDCFAEDAVAYDNGEDRELRGKAAIEKWIEETTSKYRVTLEVSKFETTGESTVLTALVSGDFPGSPIPFYYHFILHGDKITRLQIHT